MIVWDQLLEPGRKKQNVLALLICAKGAKYQKNQKEVRFAQREKRGQKELLTHILLLTQIWLLPNIVKTLTMLRNQKVAKGRAGNGEVKGLGR